MLCLVEDDLFLLSLSSDRKHGVSSFRIARSSPGPLGVISQTGIVSSSLSAERGQGAHKFHAHSSMFAMIPRTLIN